MQINENKMLRLLEKISSKNNPQIVALKVEIYSKPDSCFYNVNEKISKDNGEIIYGWKIYQSSLLIEAERHAIWKSPQGELICISPDSTTSQNILFIQEDQGWTYSGEYSDNIRINRTDNPIVDDFILLCETITKLYQTGTRESEYEMSLLQPIHNLIILLEDEKQRVENYINEGNGINNICYCKRPLLYKDCHGKNLEGDFSELLAKVHLSINKNSKD
jgi:hypothetical protein